MTKKEESGTDRTERDSDRKVAPGHEASSLSRVSAAEEYAREAEKRDEAARHRDMAAEIRDQAASRRDRAMADRERAMAEGGATFEAAVKHAEEARTLAAADRALAAEDRQKAARDRLRAAQDRAETLAALYYAHLDDLTGAYRRGRGEQAVQAEIDRARRSDGMLVLAVIDVDGLKRLNDEKGHAAGDALLRDVVAAIRANIRSYEPVVRLGGDEFACTIGGIDVGAAMERFNVIRADLARRPSRGSFTVGIAQLRPDDDLIDLILRADAAMVQARRERVGAGRD